MLNSVSPNVDLYLDKAEASMYEDYHECLAQARTASIHAQANGDIRRYALSLRYIAWALFNLKDFEASLSYAMEGVTLAHDFELIDIEAYLVNTIANVFMRCGIHKEASYLYEYQISIGKQLRDPIIQAVGLNDYAGQKVMLAEYDAAVEYLEEAATLLPEMNFRGASIRQNLAEAHRYVGAFDKAREQSAYVLQYGQAFPGLMLQARANNIQVSIALGDYDQAKHEIALANRYMAGSTQLVGYVALKLAGMELLLAEGREQEVVAELESIYDRVIEEREYGYAITVLNHIKQFYENNNDTQSLIRTYKRLSDDIPAQQQQTQELRMVVLQMVFARDKAIMKSKINLEKQKMVLLDRLSHEFRTPLAIIQSSVNTVEKYSERLSEEDRQKRLRRVTAQVQWMTTMLDDFLQLIRMDDRETLLAETTFRLEDLPQSVMASVNRYKHGDSSRIRATINSDKARIKAMHGALKSVSVQLLTNALKYSEADVLFNIDVSEKLLTMQVIDSGIGVLPSERELIFQPLTRGSNLNEQAGTGIGLAIVAKLVEHMKGKLELQSEVGKGTSVTVQIPL
jgi:signal transduction histidine kinase